MTVLDVKTTGVLTYWIPLRRTGSAYAGMTAILDFAIGGQVLLYVLSDEDV